MTEPRRTSARGSNEEVFDTVVAGSGPAGAVAALVLARAGARTLLVDPGRFPRDKACGDLVGPRGVRLLEELGVAVPGAEPVGDLVVVGPSGRSLTLPWPAGPENPACAVAAPRARLDAALQDAAAAAGAEVRVGRVAGVIGGADTLRGVELADGPRIRCVAVVGADGAMSRVAASAGLLRPARALWGFALRWYVEAAVERPLIVFWEPSPGRVIPGYGWLFPGPGGVANLGLGVGLLGERSDAGLAARRLPDFVAALRRDGRLAADARLRPGTRRGGWVRMGLAGVSPAAGTILLAGDAAGLVNPLQGEGISEAMLSGHSAAHAILAGPAEAAARHRRTLAARHGRFHPAAAALHAAAIVHPRTISALSRLLTSGPVGHALAGGWSVYWNDLLDGAPPGRSRVVAKGLSLAVNAFATPTAARREALAGLRDPAAPSHDPASSLRLRTPQSEATPL
jgi:geranylgeranyl reductase family protein